MVGRFLTGPSQVRLGPKPWYRRLRYQLPIVALVVVAAVVTDRYDRYTPEQRGTELVTFYSDINQDLSACVDGVTVAGQAYRNLTAAPLTETTKNAAALARTAEVNCTPVSDDGGVYDLDSSQVPGELSTVAQLSAALSDLQQWAYPYAARALLDVEQLDSDPGNTAAKASLHQEEAAMAGENAAAKRIFAAAAKDLGTHLQLVNLPTL